MQRVTAMATRLSRLAGRFASWILLVMILVGTWNALARKLTDGMLSSNAFIELQWFLFAMLFLLGGAYTLSRDEHVRVDVVYDRIAHRKRAMINLLGHGLLLIPFAGFMVWISCVPVWRAWEIQEQSPDPSGLPFYIVKTFVPVGFALLLLQGIAEALRAFGVVLGRNDDGEDTRREGNRSDLTATGDAADGSDAHL